MQVLAGTAAEVGFPNPLQLYTPAVGIEAGTRYLAKKLALWRDVPRALAAYNGGMPRYDEHERFRNQPYVDEVLRFLRLGAGSSSAAVAPFRWTSGTVVVAVGALVALAAVAGAMRGPRAA